SAVWYRDAYVKVCPSRVMMEVSHTTSEGAFYVEECAPTDAGSLNGISIDTLIDKYKLSNYIVKMDVEGAEKVIFEHHALDWLCDECKMLIIETHEDFFPGSGLSERIHEEMTSRNYVMERMGENKVYRKKC
ncbi:MAG: FkbM family methyltransferase, partial [Synergistaceae bacterium]|nr:FkbM family methyltransferase [Synergistaceae bacterium]